MGKAKRAGRKTADSHGVPFRTSPKKPLLIVEAWANGQGPFQFVVDTGASLTVVSPRLARQLGIRSSDKRRGKAVAASGKVDIQIAKVACLRLGQVQVPEVMVAVMGLAAVRKAIRTRIDGIIGYNILSHYRVTIDYPAGYLFLEREQQQGPDDAD